AARVSAAVGEPWAFVLATAVGIVWAVSGPFFGYSDTWQLVINTGTTVLTFLIVFLIQNAQNRDSRATPVKLDELIRAVKEARNEAIDIEEKGDEAIEELHEEIVEHKDDPPELVPGKDAPPARSRR